MTVSNREKCWARDMSGFANLILGLREKGFTVTKPLGKNGGHKTVFLAKRNGTYGDGRYVAKFCDGNDHEKEVRFATKIRQDLLEKEINPNKLIIPTVCFIKTKGYSLPRLNKENPEKGTYTCEVQPLAIQDRIIPGGVEAMPYLCAKEGAKPCQNCEFCKGTVHDWDKICQAFCAFGRKTVVLESDAHKNRQLGIWNGNPVYMDIGAPVGDLAKIVEKEMSTDEAAPIDDVLKEVRLRTITKGFMDPKTEF